MRISISAISAFARAISSYAFIGDAFRAAARPLYLAAFAAPMSPSKGI
jgi:hypothetical protein